MDVIAIRSELKRLKDKAKKTQKRKAAGAFTRYNLQVAACIAVILGFDFQAATEWLLSRKRRGTKAENGIDPSAAQQTLEEYVLSVPDDDITMWTDPSASPLPATVLKTSVKWSEGYKLKNWARRVNVENGTPIRSELMASHFNESLASNELSGFGKEVHSSSASIKDWCHRWRLRHGAKYGFLRTSEHIALEDKREQALTGVSTSLLHPQMPLLFLSTPASCCTLPVARTTSTRSPVRSSNSGGFGLQKG